MTTAVSCLVPTGDGRTLDVLVTGSGDRTVVFHAGTPCGLVALPSEVVDPTDYRLVYYARPGYARSTPHPGRSVADVAADTLAITDALDADTFVTLGWSGGGPPALACAALAPGRCRATALVAGLAPPGAGVQDWSSGKMSHAINGDIEGLTAAIEADRRDIAAADDRAVATMYATPQDLAALPEPCIDWLGAYARSAYMTSADGALEDWLSFVKPWGFEVADARNVALWHGDQDVAVTPASARWIADHLVDAPLHLLTGEGHVSIALHLPTIIADLFERAP